MIVVAVAVAVAVAVVVVVVGRDNGEGATLFEVVLEVNAAVGDVEGRISVDEVDGKVDGGAVVLDVWVRRGQTMGGAEGTYSVIEDSSVDVDVVFATAMMVPEAEDVMNIIESR